MSEKHCSCSLEIVFIDTSSLSTYNVIICRMIRGSNVRRWGASGARLKVPMLGSDVQPKRDGDGS